MFKYFVPVVILTAVSCKKTDTVPAPEKVKQQTEVKKPLVDDPNKTYIYLTFDDGPIGGTENILAVAKEENIPVTFFVIGQNIGHSASQKKILDDIKTSPLAAVCNHSYTHASGRYNYFYSKPEVVLQDFFRSRDSLKLDNHIIRMPGRNIWRLKYIHKSDNKRSIPAADLLEKNGFTAYGWDAEWHGTKNRTLVGTYKDTYKQMMGILEHHSESTPKHIVLLTHDYYYDKPYGQDQLRKLIDTLKTHKDFEFRKITDYPQKPLPQKEKPKPKDSLQAKKSVNKKAAVKSTKHKK